MTHENKLGLFIHWGVYSMYALHEQVLARYDVSYEEYEARALTFDPKDYNPEQWVLLAKNAGMKYICFTAKHHDGFCMWDTKYTDYNIMNTVYGKDVLKMLAEACLKHGMLLSIYYSCPDWHHEHGYNSASSHQWKAKNKDGEAKYEIYLDYVKNQITELLSNYGRIYTLFWDIPPKISDPSLNELARRLQPGIYINDRGYSEGDFSTPEREYEGIAPKRFERMTEACNSVGEQSWGFRTGEDFHTLKYLTSSIDKVMALGGSYLLNVGPDFSGAITPEYQKIIRRVGDWYNRISVATENHEEDTHDYGVFYNKCIVTKKGGKSYFHFYEGLVSSGVWMKNPPSVPKSVILLNTGKSLTAAFEPMISKPDKNAVAQSGLHIMNIPSDELSNEAIVIEIEW